MTNHMEMTDYMARAEVAAYLEVTPGQASRIVNRPDFPAPTYRLPLGRGGRTLRLWRGEDVARWADTHHK